VAHRDRARGYVIRVLIAVDQLGNALSGGFPDETISSRLGKRKLVRGGVLSWRDWYGVAKPLDWALDKIEPGHCVKSIQPDRGHGPAEEVRSSR
jgi:hypothetical protein